jgi:HK97 gp10 family phage protein
MNFTLKLTGVKELDKVLRGVPKELSHKLIGDANTLAAKPLVEREKQLAPVGPTGNLVSSIGVVRTTFKKANVLGEITVGPRRQGGYKGFHGHWIEFGTKKRQTKKGANRGSVPAKPFAEPAYMQTKDQVLGSINQNLGRKIIQRMKKELGSSYIRSR